MVSNEHRLTPTLVNLFAGAGGLSCGLAMAGFRPGLANELDECYASTYQTNHPDTPVVIGDIKNLLKKDLKKILDFKPGVLDLLTGGLPCQGFSINAPIRSLDDKRKHLFKDFADRCISGPNLPDGSILDSTVRKALGVR